MTWPVDARCLIKIQFFQKSRYPSWKWLSGFVRFVRFCPDFSWPRVFVSLLKITVRFCPVCPVSQKFSGQERSYPSWKSLPFLVRFLSNLSGFSRSDLVNHRNLLVHMNPHPAVRCRGAVGGPVGLILKKFLKNRWFRPVMRVSNSEVVLIGLLQSLVWCLLALE